VLKINDEIWLDIQDYEGRYKVSSLGRIMSTLTNHGKPQERVLATYIRSATCKYMYVQLWVKNTHSTVAVHRAVAMAFLPNPENKAEVNHIDGDKLNNNVCNLEWVTSSENKKHAFSTGLHNKDKITKRMIGTKWGKTSKYRNVTYDPSRSKWKGTMKHKGKMLPQKRFDTEVEAARYVNKLIEEHQLDRPKNIIN